MRRLIRPFALVGALVLAVAGCAPDGGDGQQQTGNSDAAASSTYPVTIENCEAEVVFERAPERVLLLESAPVTILDGIGVLDRVVARAGTFPAEYYSRELAQRIEQIPMLSEEIDATGHVVINSEAVHAQSPDVVLGLPEGLNREGLLDAGVNALVHPVYCPTGVGDASFESVWSQVKTYGEVFDRREEAEQLVAQLEARVAAVRAATSELPERSAAVLYPSVGGGPLYAYGRASMAQPQLEAAGLTNVFDDTAERVFEVSIEELLGRNPDVIVILHQGDGDEAAAEVTSLPGSEALHAVENGLVLPQLFNFTEPPTPLSIDGLERLVEFLGSNG